MRPSTISALAAAAVFTACSPAQAPVGDAPPEATPRSAGRVLGARIGVIEYGQVCAAAFPAMRPPLAAAVQHWRLRNDAVVERVSERFRATLEGQAERAWFDGELARIPAELRAGFDARSAAERAAFCARFLARLEDGREDVGFKYRDDVAAWLAQP